MGPVCASCIQAKSSDTRISFQSDLQCWELYFKLVILRSLYNHKISTRLGLPWNKCLEIELNKQIFPSIFHKYVTILDGCPGHSVLGPPQNVHFCRFIALFANLFGSLLNMTSNLANDSKLVKLTRNHGSCCWNQCRDFTLKKKRNTARAVQCPALEKRLSNSYMVQF